MAINTLFLAVDDAAIALACADFAHIYDIAVTTIPDGAVTLCNSDNALILMDHDQAVRHYAMPVRLASMMYDIAEYLHNIPTYEALPDRLSCGSDMQLITHLRVITREDDDAHLLELTEKEAALLAHLLVAGTQGVARDDLLARVWGYHPDTQTRTLDSHIYRLRQKLALLPDGVVEIAMRASVYYAQ